MHTTDLLRGAIPTISAPLRCRREEHPRVLILAAIMMIAEIVFGLKLHSMALFADGCHMGTHVAAFFITVGAYAFARRHSTNVRYSFGTGKIAVLGAFTARLFSAALPALW